METKELLKNLKNQSLSFEELLEWCESNKEKMNLKDTNCEKLYNILVRYLMNEKLGHIEKKKQIYVYVILLIKLQKILI